MKKLNAVMTEIDEILASISEHVDSDGVNINRCNGLHALFYEKVNVAIALRCSSDLSSTGMLD